MNERNNDDTHFNYPETVLQNSPLISVISLLSPYKTSFSLSKEIRDVFPDKDHVLTISSGLPCEDGVLPWRPSLEITESGVLYNDNDKNSITHKWNVDKQRWNKVKG